MRTHWLAPLIISLVLLVSAGSAGVAASSASTTSHGLGDSTDISSSDSSPGTDEVTAQQAPPGNWEVLIDDGQTSTEPAVGIDTISAQHTAETFYVQAEYHGEFDQQDDIDFAVFLDTDQQTSTGLNSDSSNYDRYNEHMNGIGADYLAVAGLEGNSVWEWDNSDWNQRSANFSYLDFDYDSNTVTVGIDRSSIGSPDAIDIVTGDAIPSTENWDWAPDENEGHLTYAFDTSTPTFDFGVELQGEASASVGESATITAYPSNNAETAVSDTTLELLVDTNTDGEFTSSEVVASRTLDFNAGEYRTVDLTYSDIQLAPGDYTYQARISKDGETATSYTTGTLTVSDDTDQPSGDDPVVEETVSVGGSTVTFEGGDVSAIGVTGIPDAYYPVTDIGSGILQQGDNGIFWQTGGTVSFTLTPPDSAEAGDTVSFDVKLGSQDVQTVTLEVVDPGTFDFGVELQGEATASVGESATITAYPNNLADTAVSDTTLELLVDTNNDGEFTASEVVASQSLDFNAGEYRTVDLTYSNIQLTPGDYTYQARISKDGQTTTSYTTGTLTVSGDTDQPSGPGPVVEETVELGGSTVTIEGGDVSAIGVTGIPDAYYPVTDIGDTGTLQQGDNGVLWQTGGTVSFTLTPPESAEAGDTVSFDVKLGANDPQTVTLDVSNVPADLPSSISADQYLAVAGDNGEIGTFDLVDAIDGAKADGSYNGVEFSTFDFITLIEYNAE